MKTIATNKKAYHDYFVIEKYEAGINLIGCEVKSLRAGEVTLKDSFVRVDTQATLINCRIANYDKGSYANTDPFRPRRLLLAKREIKRLRSKIVEKGYTVVPLSLYFVGSLVKVEIALVKGKVSYDKRESIAARDSQRDTERQLKEYAKKG